MDGELELTNISTATVQATAFATWFRIVKAVGITHT